MPDTRMTCNPQYDFMYLHITVFNIISFHYPPPHPARPTHTPAPPTFWLGSLYLLDLLLFFLPAHMCARKNCCPKTGSNTELWIVLSRGKQNGGGRRRRKMGSREEKDREQKKGEEEILWRTVQHALTSSSFLFFCQFPASDSFFITYSIYLGFFALYLSLVSSQLPLCWLSKFFSSQFKVWVTAGGNRRCSLCGRRWQWGSILFHCCWESQSKIEK